ncbi:MAG: CHAT domain-containing protein [Cyanobacteria bacterium J055]|nr:MAG: CHAT domain-containing protein [Cyanobacteria bacterium J055]
MGGTTRRGDQLSPQFPPNRSRRRCPGKFSLPKSRGVGGARTGYCRHRAARRHSHPRLTTTVPTGDRTDRRFTPPNPDDRVIFIPQGALFLVPFPALPDGTGTYLIEKHTIQTAPSIQVLELTRQAKERGNATGEALVVGNPAMPEIALQWDATPQRLSPLPGAEGEAVEIARILETEPLLGDRATETAIVERMSRAQTIHLATHGLLDELVLHLETQGRSPARLEALNFPGALALTPSATDDGLLTTAEIAQLDLHAELVVLSACDTGRGELTGDGVVGLARSFGAAGASSIVVSLWQVPDAPTALLMTEFYRNLQENPDRARALRQAMLTIKQTHPHPADWAAFTLIGETD